jgi:hypothetical protein
MNDIIGYGCGLACLIPIPSRSGTCEEPEWFPCRVQSPPFEHVWLDRLHRKNCVGLTAMFPKKVSPLDVSGCRRAITLCFVHERESGLGASSAVLFLGARNRVGDHDVAVWTAYPAKFPKDIYRIFNVRKQSQSDYVIN